jgi:hypothetical protein
MEKFTRKEMALIRWWRRWLKDQSLTFPGGVCVMRRTGDPERAWQYIEFALSPLAAKMIRHIESGGKFD